MINRSKKLLRNVALVSTLGIASAGMLLPATAMAHGRGHHHHHHHWRRHAHVRVVFWNPRPRPCWRCDPYYYGPQPVVYRRVVFRF